MFNWTTTTIINSLSDYTTGLPLVKVWNGAETLEGKDLPSGFSGVGPVIKIKRDHTFEGRYISKIYKAMANNPILCKLEVDVTTLVEKVKALAKDSSRPISARLAFYVGLEGSEESIYANDWYQKGKPFSIGFDVLPNEEASDVAKKIKKNAEKFGIVMYGKKIFDIEPKEETTLVITGTHEYQRFKMAAVAVDDVIDEMIADYFEDGEVLEGESSDNGVFTLVKRGLNGFGTYHQLVKDLRLPTVHHNKWLQIKEDEKPVVGAKYNQFIITYCAPSMANPGFTVIGQHNMSLTTHVFWVNQAVSDKFEEYLAQVANVIPVNDVVTENAEEVTLQIGGEDTVTYEEEGVRTTGGENFSASHAQKVVHTEADAEAGKTSVDDQD